MNQQHAKKPQYINAPTDEQVTMIVGKYEEKIKLALARMSGSDDLVTILGSLEELSILTSNTHEYFKNTAAYRAMSIFEKE